MSTEEIANKLVAWCNSGQEEKCYQELYSPDIVSIEPEGSSENPIARGMEEVAKKGEWWRETFEMHNSHMSDPIIAENWFSVRHEIDVTHKPSGHRNKMAEISVYTVNDGKIVREQFFYDVPNQG